MSELLSIERNVYGDLSASKQIYYEEKKPKQTTMDIFLKRVTLHQEEPQAGPSQDVPEGGLSSQEMTALCALLSLETFQWDKMWRWNTGILLILTLCGPRLMCVYVPKFLTKTFKK